MIKFKEINSSTLSSIKYLLYQRSHTMPEYVDWKYGSESPRGFRGILAFDRDQEIGCFGSIPLQGITKNGKVLDIGWFADWFVSPAYRGHGLGNELLRALIKENPYFLGHPGPRYAVDICLQAGWNQLGFQSKYRWVYHSREYYRHRSQNSTKATIKIIYTTIKKLLLQLNPNSITKKKRPSLIELELLINDDFEKWYIAQPCIPEIQRKYDKWVTGNIKILFADQLSSVTNEKYRKVILIDPISELSRETLSQFISDSKKSNIDYVELLTGSPELDLTCKKLMGIQISESPIVYTGFSNQLIIPKLQGIHRENWLFQAARK